MPEAFEFFGAPELWHPLGLSGDQWAGRYARYLRVVGRLAPGVGLDQAQREMDLISERLAREHPANEGWTTVVNSLEAEVTENIRPAMSVLAAASALLLVVCCVKPLMNLLLAGGGGSSSRGRYPRCPRRQHRASPPPALHRERHAEHRWRARRFAPCARWKRCPGALDSRSRAKVERDRHRWARCLRPPWPLAIGCGIVVGAAPAFRLVSVGLQPALARASVDASMGLRRDRLSRVFSGMQIAVSFVLLVVAGLFMRSYIQLTRVDPGFDADHVVSLGVELPENVYREGVQRAEFHRQVLERVRAIPGVVEAGGVSSLPLDGATTFVRFEIPGRATTDRDFAPFYAVTPGYFETMRIPFAIGSEFRGSRSKRCSGVDDHQRGTGSTIIRRRRPPRQDDRYGHQRRDLLPGHCRCRRLRAQSGVGARWWPGDVRTL